MSAPFNPRFDPFDPDLDTSKLPDIDFSSINWNDPASAFAAMGGGPGGLPIPTLITPEEKYLNDILDRHEPTIHKRWQKKTKKQRIKVLTAVWPNISTTHRPDFYAFRNENEHQRSTGTRFRDSFMWPCINIEDLSKPKTLLLFLQARSRNTPDAFAMADFNSVHLGCVSKAIVPPFLNQYTMMLNRPSPRTYGELIAWDDNDEAFGWLVSQRGMHPGQGLLVLEIQHRTFQFLVDCCQQIMHEIPSQDLISSSYPTQPPATLVKETIDGFSSLAIMAAEAPYRRPADMDLERLLSLIETRKIAAEDHILALREDPNYFAQTILEFRDNRQEMLKDTKGANHPLLNPLHEDTFWERIIGNVVSNAYFGHQVWTELHAQIKNVLKLEAKYRSSINPNKDLPEEYLNALLTFQYFLKQATKGPKDLLKHHVVASPPLRQFYVRTPPQDLSSPIIEVMSKQGAKMDKVQGELIWLLKVLWEDGHELFLIGLTNIMDELDRLIQSDQKAKGLISGLVNDIIFDLGVLSESLRQLNHYHPWAENFETQLAEREDGIKKSFAQRTAHWSPLLRATLGPMQKTIVRLGKTKDNKFFYPIDKRRTKQNVEALRSAERNLDMFWEAVDRNTRHRLGHDFEKTALSGLLSQSRKLQRTPEWVEPTPLTTINDATRDIDQPLSNLYLDLEINTERTIDHSDGSKTQLSKKTKTKGLAASSALATDTIASSKEPDVPEQRFPLDPRALKVFRTLFYIPTLDATPGEVPWKDFLHAMVSTGFEPEKLYGSVWHFRPVDVAMKRSIQFHEPHPSGKLAYNVARRFGRRLYRAYGWEAGTFVPK